MVYLLGFIAICFLVCLLAKPEWWLCRFMEFGRKVLNKRINHDS